MNEVWYVAGDPDAELYGQVLWRTKIDAERYARELFPNESEDRRYARIFYKTVQTYEKEKANEKL